ncbi:MAG: oxidoreductase [Clostridiales Family XIII bacterium]|jgi:Fe-S-cluster-containing dehydrogenase component|nr:oxidoreductase [Clostridiales Family XIII bacterium]
MTAKKYLVIDLAYCHDCNNCFIACKDEHCLNGDRWLPYTDEQPRHGHRWMNIEKKERGQYPRISVTSLPKPCQHCADPKCKEAASGAVTVRGDGIVLLDSEKAKGRRDLVDSCPFGAIWYNEEKGVAQKCTFCAHILDGKADWGVSVALLPRCAHSCPTSSIAYYEMDAEAFGQLKAAEGLERYRPEESPDGQVWYKNLAKWTRHFIAGGLLKGGECAEGVTVALTGAGLPAQETNFFGDFCFDGLAPGTYTVVADGKDVTTVELEKSVNLGSIAI